MQFLTVEVTQLKGNYHENMTFGVKRQMCSYEEDKIYGEANLSEFYLILAKSVIIDSAEAIAPNTGEK